ncbi:aromatic ring-hydroxylating oxygenase subunit alpha [Dasania marina]|uniref:aromatic ring-hydroxylating oxygenase subunit alpha n=1 Tax=Dasania marina TaxID=471499 RepID=UPI00037D8A09|nr:aromatic ring-hydroxylating dioxygenase subunit alpha [Dasania marina]
MNTTSLDQSKEVSINQAPAMPINSTYSENDWQLLASFWHPVALSQELTDKPLAVTLLDKKLVLFRTASGVTTSDNNCPHRGASLSDGWISDGHLTCPYHAFQFDGTGKCTKVPAHGEDYKISARIRLTTYMAAEKYGLIWVCLNNTPRQALPVHKRFDEADGETFKMFHLESAVWNCSTFRHAENFNDLAHIHTVHDASFGDRRYSLVPDYEVVDTDVGFRREVTMPARARADFNDPLEEAVPCQFIYNFTFPFTSMLEIYPPGGDEEHVMDVVSPMSATQTRVFMVKGRTYKLDDKFLGDILEYQHATNDEDRAIVEGQYPQLVPLDMSAECHIPADRWSAHLRRRWRAMGLENKVIARQ